MKIMFNIVTMMHLADGPYSLFSQSFLLSVFALQIIVANSLLLLNRN